ncbi:MAG TPA: hypothetical protein VN851_08470 [Thermoanaerobaculia bacterium]|nr:hypothetical protein [Thermoanaerobaculia bacterium]
MDLAAAGANLVEEAVRAVGRGDQGAARSLLLRASEIAPAHDLVWLWLAQISSSPSDKASYLRRVLELHPGHEVARTGLADALRDEGIAAAKAGSRKRARSLLKGSIELDRNHEDAWLWLAAVAETEEERRYNLAQVLAIDPAHRQALVLLDLLAARSDSKTGGSLREEAASQHLKREGAEHGGPVRDDADDDWSVLLEQVVIGWELEDLTDNRSNAMANIKESLQGLTEIDGFIGACLVDSNSGMMMGAEGGGPSMDLEAAAAGNTEVVRAKRKTMATLGLKDTIEDILITLGKQYHLIRPLATRDGLFIYLVLDKSRSNLALARHRLADAERDLTV